LPINPLLQIQQGKTVDVFGDHGLRGLREEDAHEKSPKCLDGNLGNFAKVSDKAKQKKSSEKLRISVFRRPFVKWIQIQEINRPVAWALPRNQDKDNRPIRIVGQQVRGQSPRYGLGFFRACRLVVPEVSVCRQSGVCG